MAYYLSSRGMIPIYEESDMLFTINQKNQIELSVQNNADSHPIFKCSLTHDELFICGVFISNYKIFSKTCALIRMNKSLMYPFLLSHNIIGLNCPSDSATHSTVIIDFDNFSHKLNQFIKLYFGTIHTSEEFHTYISTHLTRQQYKSLLKGLLYSKKINNQKAFLECNVEIVQFLSIICGKRSRIVHGGIWVYLDKPITFHQERRKMMPEFSDLFDLLPFVTPLIVFKHNSG